MIGKEFARALRKARKPIFVAMIHPHEPVYVKAVKQDLIDWADGLGDNETHMTLDEGDDTIYVEVDQETIYNR